MSIKLPGMGEMKDDGTTVLNDKEAIKDIQDKYKETPNSVKIEDTSDGSSKA